MFEQVGQSYVTVQCCTQVSFASRQSYKITSRHHTLTHTHLAYSTCPEHVDACTNNYEPNYHTWIVINTIVCRLRVKPLSTLSMQMWKACFVYYANQCLVLVRCCWGISDFMQCRGESVECHLHALMCSVTVVFIHTMEDDQRLNTLVHEGDTLHFSLQHCLWPDIALFFTITSDAEVVFR